MFAATALLGILIGIALGWVGRFALFAVALALIGIGSVLAATLGSRPVGEVLLLALLVVVTLQIGYAIRLLVGAVLIARRRRRAARAETLTVSQEAPAADHAEPPAAKRFP